MAKAPTYHTDQSSSALCRLREEVATAAGFEPRTPLQFDQLADRIHQRTGVLLSSTTLKRIWNYLDEAVTPRRTTLDVLARFCGWQNLADFESHSDPEIESGNLGGSVIRAGENIRPGERVRLFWAPARVCEIEYTGQTGWKVIASEGTRLQSGDTFTCPLIITGEPLYLDNLLHAGCRAGAYVCGHKNGITFQRMN